VGIDLSNAWKSGEKILNGAISLLPNMALAVLLFVAFLFLASAARSVVLRFSRRRQKRQNLGLLLGQLTHVTVVVLGFLIALSVVAPSFHASDLIKMLGIGSVAIGFAFQNILQNFLAGILLLMQEPFKLGDIISVTGLEGRVDDIQARATVISTPDGHRAVIPNAVLFTNPVVVSNGYATKNAPPASPQLDEAQTVKR
jgi:small-conductance mechanosensitive channel